MEKPPKHWIFLRGMGRESRHWTSLVKKFESCFPESTVLALDLPGMGRRNREKSPRSIAAIVDDLRTRVPQAEPLGAVGLSLGGMVVAEWLHRYPKDISHAVLINTSFGNLSRPWERLYPKALLQLARTLHARTPRDRELEILRVTSNRPEIYANTAIQWGALHAESPISLQNIGRQLHAATKWKAKLTAPQAKVLLLKSKTDHLVSPKCTDAIAKAWNAPVAEHPTAGHELTLDAPEWFLEKVPAVFLDR